MRLCPVACPSQARDRCDSDAFPPFPRTFAVAATRTAPTTSTASASPPTPRPAEPTAAAAWPWIRSVSLTNQHNTRCAVHPRGAAPAGILVSITLFPSPFLPPCHNRIPQPNLLNAEWLADGTRCRGSVRGWTLSSSPELSRAPSWSTHNDTGTGQLMQVCVSSRRCYAVTACATLPFRKHLATQLARYTLHVYVQRQPGADLPVFVRFFSCCRCSRRATWASPSTPQTAWRCASCSRPTAPAPPCSSCATAPATSTGAATPYSTRAPNAAGEISPLGSLAPLAGAAKGSVIQLPAC